MPTEEPDARSGPVTVMRINGAFRLLIAGSSVSVLGTRVTTIAYPLLVLYLTSSPVTAGYVAFAATAPSLLVYIPVGALVDRWDPWRTMLVSESCRGVIIGIVAGMLISGRPDVPLLIGAVVAEEILKSFSMLAEPRYVCLLVKDDREKRSVLASMEGRTHVAVLAGRPLGAFLFGLMHTLPFLFDSVSFLFSIGTLIGIRTRKEAVDKALARSADRQQNMLRESLTDYYSEKIYENNYSQSYQLPTVNLGRDIRRAFCWLKLHPRVLVIIFLAAGATFISQALIMVFLAAAHERHLSFAMTGMILATSGIGGIAGSMTGSRLKSLLAAPRLEKSTIAQCLRTIAGRPLIQIQLAVWTAAFAVLCALGAESFFLMAAVMTVLGFTGALSNIQFNTYLMTKVPKRMLARVMSIGSFASLAACAIGPAVGGLLIRNYQTSSALNSLLLMTAFMALASFGLPWMRSREAGSAASASPASVTVRRPASGEAGTAGHSAEAPVRSAVLTISYATAGGTTDWPGAPRRAAAFLRVSVTLVVRAAGRTDGAGVSRASRHDGTLRRRLPARWDFVPPGESGVAKVRPGGRAGPVGTQGAVR